MNMYPTMHGSLTDFQVNALFRADSWYGDGERAALTAEERMDALQELENRSAAELGRGEPCEVVMKAYEEARYGEYSEGRIYVNENLVGSDAFRIAQDDGTVSGYEPGDVNAQMMDTIHHESFHAFQEGIMRTDFTGEEARMLRANDESCIGEGVLYRLQPMEKSAWEYGEAKTRGAFGEIEAVHGEDRGFRQYLRTADEDSYAALLAQAKEIYGEDVESDLADGMLEKYAQNHAEEFTSAGLRDESGEEAAAAPARAVPSGASDELENGCTF